MSGVWGGSRSVSKMGAKERIMWDALSFGYFLQEAEDNLLLTV